MCRRAPAYLLILACLGSVAGCTEVEEELSLRSDGTGTYALTLAWDPALVRDLVALVGSEVAARFEGRPLPWREEDWRAGIRNLEGVQVNELAVTDRSDGWREVRLKLGFDRLEDLLRWEIFARRDLRLTHGPEAAVLETGPLADVPVLDPIAAALDRRDTPPAAEEEGGFPLLDPGPFERLGLSLSQATLAAEMLAPRLDRVRIRLVVRDPRRSETTFRFTFDDLRRSPDRRLRVQWARRDFDRVSEIEHAGDRPVSDPPR